MNKVTTLDDFILSRQKDFPFASGELSGLLRDIGLASKIIHYGVNKAGLIDILGQLDATNYSGDTVNKLDAYADEQFITYLRNSGECCGVGSEEHEDFIAFGGDLNNATYVVLIDPLDGSSNIDVNGSIGSIFSIYRRKTKQGTAPILEDFLQKGVSQVAAGYVLYGSSTMLVYTTGKGVNGFTLDPAIGEFCLSHQNMKIPKSGIYYSVNEGNLLGYSEEIQKFLYDCKRATEERNKLKHRYVGALVADVHRTLIKGGIFLYPGSASAPLGKLRLQYECNPIAFIVEQADGLVTTGDGSVLHINPTELHQRTPFILGSKDLVEECLRFNKESQTIE